jgi:DNA-binding IclR family transcriptional regulator
MKMNNNIEIQNKKPIGEAKSIIKAISILKALNNDCSKLSDISRQINLGKSTVHRLLSTLKEYGLVIQDSGSQEYFLGPLLFDIANNPLVIHKHLIYATYNKMYELRQIIGETISLDIRYGMEKFKLQQLASLHNIAYTNRAIIFDQLWSGASGKIILAQLPDDELQIMLDNVNLVALTPHTITDKLQFKHEILKARERGYSTSIEETELGVAAIAVPLKNYVVPASIAIIGPENRITKNMLDSIEILKLKAKEISDELLKLFNNRAHQNI